MAIRKANSKELEEINRMVPDVFKSSITVDFDLSEASMRVMSKQLLQEGASYFIYSEDEVIQGFVLVDKKVDALEQKEYGFIYELYVLEAYRNQGIAEALIHFVNDYYKRHNVSEVRLNVYASNCAKNLYEKLGFRERTITMSIDI
ncbi:GNAT family N-acetyltransferase [Staphylococcus xylosus]|uniref:GNAT family N-acetyltransferase n=1 Tax=Staphylococcus xylosus TaxID=1288 RepID=UPI000E696633|nr:GNAT family N-acetyltransferase [Staphylococcus xylosus]MEB8307197.1 GNAT family N-acetyltransferase [Staphylococcus xylosus]RIM74938.1 GNAT family N-acetyltransferase [Staphylococcus xylosus]WRY40395.1 GNAT family N-acetyltransferase [Staphylococcus xylosus]